MYQRVNTQLAEFLMSQKELTLAHNRPRDMGGCQNRNQRGTDVNPTTWDQEEPSLGTLKTRLLKHVQNSLYNFDISFSSL
jgi:hypothetical protein